MNGIFGINGLAGYAVAVLLVVGGAVAAGAGAIYIQKNQSTHYYKIQGQTSIKMRNVNNSQHYEAIPK